MRATLGMAPDVIARLGSVRRHSLDRTQLLHHRIRRLADETAARRDAARFAEVERFCLFVGFARSGHTLVGAMLDAHPDMVVAHELGALKLVSRGWNRSALYAAVMRYDREFASRGWENQDDVFEIPGQWQGRVRRLRVIGDKNGNDASLRLAEDPGLIDRLRAVVGVPVRIVVVVRNPFDNIARIARRSGTSVLAAAGKYELFARSVQGALDGAGAGGALVAHHEDTIADPRAALRRLAGFLEVEPDDAWVEACAGIVLPSPRLARDAVEWSPAERLVVEELIGRFDFLGCYAES